jgi:putative addiction module killer protein
MSEHSCFPVDLVSPGHASSSTAVPRMRCGQMAATGVRRGEAAFFQWVQVPPCVDASPSPSPGASIDVHAARHHAHHRKLLNVYDVARLDGLRDIRARARILVRVERLAVGNPGDATPVGEGVSELRIHYGPGYRVYYKQQGRELAVLLAGGDKRTQTRDILTALRLARDL